MMPFLQALDVPESEMDCLDLETDYDRRQVLLDSTGQEDRNSLKAKNYDFSDDFPGLTDTSRLPSSSLHTTRKRPTNDDPSILWPKKRKTACPNSSHTDSTIDEKSTWNCQVCTLYVSVTEILDINLTALWYSIRTNQPGHLACSACSTPRGDSEWVGTIQIQQ